MDADAMESCELVGSECGPASLVQTWSMHTKYLGTDAALYSSAIWLMVHVLLSGTIEAISKKMAFKFGYALHFSLSKRRLRIQIF